MHLARLLPHGLLLFLIACAEDDPTKVARTSRDRTAHPDLVSSELAYAERPSAGSAPRRGGQIALALVADVDSFNSYLSTTAYAREVHHLLYPFLLREEPDYHRGPPTMKPNLVDEWQVEGKTVRMRLREGVSWSDGRPITSDDVAFSLEAARHDDVAWVQRPVVDFIERIETTGPRTFTVHFQRRYTYMLKDANNFRVLPKHVFGAVPFPDWKGHDWSAAARACVSGPYRLASYRQGEEFVLERNERYWNQPLPRIERVIVRIIRERDTMVGSLLAGEVAAIDQVPPRDARRVLDHDDLLLYEFGGLIYEYLGWNCTHELFTDPEVRRAMTLAIDRSNIVESLLYGHGRLMAGPFLSTEWARDRSLKPLPHDPEQARAILGRKGWKAGAGDGDVLQKDGRKFEFVLFVAAGRKQRLRVAQFVQSDLGRIGVRVRLQQTDFNSMSGLLRRKDTKERPAAWIGGWWKSSKVDEKAFFHTDEIPNFNFGAYSNPKGDDLIQRARLAEDRDAAMALWREYQRIWIADQPYTLLYELRMLNAARKRFHGVRMTAMNTYDNLPEWWAAK